MNQPNQQNAPAKWAPTPDTIFLLLSDEEFGRRARAHLQALYPGLRYRVQTEIKVDRIGDRHVVVPVYQDPDKLIIDAETKQPRPRKPGTRSMPGLPGQRPEPPDVLVGKPVDVAKYWSEGADNDSAVQLTNLKDEDGKTMKGLISAIADQIRPNVVHHRADLHVISLRTV